MNVEYAVVSTLLFIGIAMIITGLVGLVLHKREPKPEPVPWDGVHKLRGVRHVDDFSGGQYDSGWWWECTCGIGNKHVITPMLPYTELGAVKEYREHAQLYKDMEKPDYLRALNHAVENGA